jgi:hypothetical protein
MDTRGLWMDGWMDGRLRQGAQVRGHVDTCGAHTLDTCKEKWEHMCTRLILRIRAGCCLENERNRDSKLRDAQVSTLS